MPYQLLFAPPRVLALAGLVSDQVRTAHPSGSRRTSRGSFPLRVSRSREPSGSPGHVQEGVQTFGLPVRAPTACGSRPGRIGCEEQLEPEWVHSGFGISPSPQRDPIPANPSAEGPCRIKRYLVTKHVITGSRHLVRQRPRRHHQMAAGSLAIVVTLGTTTDTCCRSSGCRCPSS